MCMDTSSWLGCLLTCAACHAVPACDPARAPSHHFVQAVAVPAPRLSSASFVQQDQENGGSNSGGAAVANGTFAALFSTAAAAVAEQLSADGFPLHHQSQPKATHKAADGEGGVLARGSSSNSSSSVAGNSEEGRSNIGLPSRHAVPAKWWLRCAVVNNLLFHIDVMAGWAYAFQVSEGLSAGNWWERSGSRWHAAHTGHVTLHGNTTASSSTKPGFLSPRCACSRLVAM